MTDVRVANHPATSAVPRMSGGEAVVAGLLAQGVDTLFGIPGVQTYALFDALERAQPAINVVCPRHEQATGYMAFGYAQSTGRIGVYSVVPGPGVLNSGAALSSAYGASTPLLCLTGEVPSKYIGSGLGHLHELPDQQATLSTLTKWASRIDQVALAPRLVDEAFRQALSGRPRPVALAVPWDVYDDSAPILPLPKACPDPPPPLDPREVEHAAHLLSQAEHPMIMVGSGAISAAEQIRALAEALQAPVVSFRGGRGIVSDEHHLGFTCAQGFRRWAQTDVLLGVGSRLELEWFRWPPRPSRPRMITIDIDPLQKVRLRPDLGIVGDALQATTALLEAMPATDGRASLTKEFSRLKAETQHDVERDNLYVPFLHAIRDALPRDGFFVEEICQAGFTSYYAFPVYQPRQFVTNGHQGTLGFGFSTALGVKVARPDRAVVSITGDGGLMFGIQELATAAQYNIGLVTVLFNNNAYGNVWRDQQTRFDGRTIGALLKNPDFPRVADSFGVQGRRASTPSALRTEITAALDSGAPTLIEVPVPLTAGRSPWEVLMPARAL